MTGRTPVDVAVGILIRPDGALLLASRPAGKPYADYWEFPGGKVEPGESVAHALMRELHEELGIEVREVLPWVVRVHDYPHALVRLHFCRVYEWTGVPHAREDQQFGFFQLDRLPAPLLPATIPVLRGLALPDFCAITAAAALGPQAFLLRLDAALARGLRLVVLREPDLADRDVLALFDAVSPSVRCHGARLLVSSRHPQPMWERADGVHLTGEALMGAHRRPACKWVSASVHAPSELLRASELNLDFALLGPVQPTRSHPDRAALGWSRFEAIALQTAIPVYALGGLAPADLVTARRHGAHGVAMLSAAWQSGQCFDSGISVGGVWSASSEVLPGTT